MWLGMEHLLFRDDILPPITVPYICSEDYDGGDFHSFPERRGWDVSTWQWSTPEDGFNLNGKSVRDMAAFLQTWLFFGLLNSVLQIVLKDDFIRADDKGQLFLTTRLLPSYLNDWEDRITPLGEEEKKYTNDKVLTCLAEASVTNDWLTWLLKYGEYGSDFELLRRTLFAQTLLLEALKGAESQIFHGELFSAKARVDDFLRAQMLEAGWCISTVDYMQENLPLYTQTFAFSLGSVRTSLDHSQCIADRTSGCRLSRVGQDYKPKHVTLDCQCAFIHSPIDEIIKVLRSGMIPLITIKRVDDEPCSLNLAVDGVDLSHPDLPCIGGPYVAITHCWADGLGNMEENALPQCQLERLRTMTQTLQGTTAAKLSAIYEMKASRFNTVPFWFDTLCIPVKKEHQGLRDFSIQKMHDIYAKAAGVLVIDPDIQQLPFEATPLEAMTRILCSGWRARLWTYQEGTLAKHLHLPVHGRTFNFYQEKDVLPLDNSGKNLIEIQLIQDAWLRYTGLVWDIVAQASIKVSPERALISMLKAISHRVTTRQDDETICIATFLGIDPTPLLQAHAEDRMSILLALLPVTPPELLFATGPRLQMKGFRWASKSFLIPYGLDDNMLPSLPKRCIQNSADGEVEQDIPRSFLHPDGLGLAVFLKAIRIRRPRNPISYLFSISIPGDCTYVIEARDTLTGIPWESVSLEKFDESAILLTESDISLFVESVHEIDSGECLARWKFIVTVNKLSDFANIQGFDIAEQNRLEGEYVPFRWWVVD
ncbi:hypothetical protein AOQ84DRAFT_383762 [Glonium stellatum]|uniref:Heterokaryon incompatibility domain-containing protein n=1 Tax=Glonium stellatum TaxID=574774 RepID=A0A8E2EMF7_9PEZI|nr:hypothetical protein AOQ84DRAFT_383762 [Glonium stellatum]